MTTETIRKTTNEIINETVATYTKITRAVNDQGHCFYLEPQSGRCCAFGRCCSDPQSNWIGTVHTLRVLGANKNLDMESVLKPEYQGHPSDFWRDIQKLHDHINNWTLFGLSEIGKAFVQQIRNRWEDQDSLIPPA